MTKKSSTRSSHNGKARAKSSPSKEAVYLLSLSLENVRCFKETQTLDLSDGQGKPRQWTILLGNNGTGKTTILQALALGMDYLFETPPYEKTAANLHKVIFLAHDHLYLLRQSCSSFRCDLQFKTGNVLKGSGGPACLRGS